jgi:hypothetical protein
MKLIETGLKLPKTDIWGFKLIWVPIGKEGDIKDELGDTTKVIKLSDVLNPQSISTLAGIPVYLYHPDVGAVDPNNFDGFETVGVCTDKYRLVEGGVEVQVKVTKSALYPFLDSQIITHVSPCYTEENGFRSYNHIALLPPGWAKGGDKMFISLEGFSGKQASENSFTGVKLPRESYLLPIDKETNKNKIYMNIEEILGQLLASQASLCESFNTFSESMKTAKTESEACVTESMDTESMDKESMETEAKKAAYCEGFTAGKQAGQVISLAKSHGFNGEDEEEANKFVITKAYPSLSIEGFSSAVLSGIYQGAVESLKQNLANLAPKLGVETESGKEKLELVEVPVITEKNPSHSVTSKRMKISAT